MRLWNARFRALRNLLVLVLIGESTFLAMFSPAFEVRRIVVSGAQVRSPKDIVRLGGLPAPGNIFRAPAERAEKRLAMLPEVASVSVERRLPRTLVVAITERKPLASVLTPTECWVMDAEGIIYRKLAGPLRGYPVLVVRPREKVILGRPLPMVALSTALECLAQIPDLPLAKNVRFHVDESQLAWLNDPDGFKVRLGPLDNAPERLAISSRILNGPDGREIMRKAIVLDVTTPNSEVYRPRGAENL